MFRETDVVFLGDSIIEGWIGRSLGQQKERKHKNIKVFEELFDMDKGGDFDGIALGISGDKSQNLLWRLKHGEMPKSLKSKVYWVLIGTNDFLYAEAEQCSEEVILMGIKRVVEEMMILRPSATIVVNGLLPRSDIGRGTDGRLYEKDEKTVMDAIDIVNEKLKAYCDLHDDLEYFDPSGLFEDEDPKLGKGKFAKYIPKDLMKDALHPTALGYKKWGQKIVEKLRSVLDVKLDVE
jgi:lysophospholipase L1-like esterase